MKQILLTIIVIPMIFFGQIYAQEQYDGLSILKKMLNEIPKTQRLEYTLKAWERFDEGNKEMYNAIITKWNRTPLKMYMKNIEGSNKNVEVLWVKGEYDNKAYVNKLWGLKLDPYGSLIRKDQHHTLFNTGFDFLADIIGHAITKAETEAASHPDLTSDDVFNYTGNITWDGRECFKIEINDPTFKYYSYSVKEGESLDKFSKEKRICGYLIIDKNKNVCCFDDFDAGKTVLVPSSYAKKTVLYVDAKTYMPVVQIMNDEKGQFERYEFYKLKINPVFKSTEFTEDYDGYNF